MLNDSRTILTWTQLRNKNTNPETAAPLRDRRAGVQSHCTSAAEARRSSQTRGQPPRGRERAKGGPRTSADVLPAA